MSCNIFQSWPEISQKLSVAFIVVLLPSARVWSCEVIGLKRKHDAFFFLLDSTTSNASDSLPSCFGVHRTTTGTWKVDLLLLMGSLNSHFSCRVPWLQYKGTPEILLVGSETFRASVAFDQMGMNVCHALKSRRQFRSWLRKFETQMAKPITYAKLPEEDLL